MKHISAEGNLSIAVSPDRWQLIRNGDMQAQVIMEAEANTPLQYSGLFGESRRLPESGTLDLESIRRVVLGWSERDSSWHLGLMLEPSIAEERGSRWCELARWHDPAMSPLRATATEAGEALAQTISRPFYLVPPSSTESQPTPEPAPVIPQAPLAALPLTADLWTLERATSEALALKLSKKWSNALIRQILWHIFWAAVYIALLYGAYTAGIAPIQPVFLPYLAVFSVVVLAGLIIRNLYRLFTHTNRLSVHSDAANMTAYHDASQRWTEAQDNIKAVYVSHVFTKGDVRKGKTDALPQYSELNLLLADGSFCFLLAYEDTKETASLADAPADGVHLLGSNEAQTQLQAIALHLAAALGVPCYYDFRAR